jgi:eukaryotic-like serine/threonine-protein kinase
VTALLWPGHGRAGSEPAAAAAPSCEVAYSMSVAPAGRSTTTVTVTNTASSPTGPWTLTFRLPGGQRLVRGADASWHQDGEVVEARGNGLPADATARTWFEATYADTARLPQSFALNDVACGSELSVRGPSGTPTTLPGTPAVTVAAKRPKPATVAGHVAAKPRPGAAAPGAKGPAAARAVKHPTHPAKPPAPPRRRGH